MLLFSPSAIFAQQQNSTEVQVFFRKGYSTLDTQYKNNGENLETFIRQYHTLARDPRVTIKSLSVTGVASPEGSYSLNIRLARKRAENIATYLKPRLSVDQQQIAMDVRGEGIGWSQLEEAVKMQENMPDRDQVLEIIRTTPEFGLKNGVRIELRKSRLINLNDGRAWHYIYHRIFPLMRYTGAHVTLVYELAAPEVEEPKTEEITPAEPTEIVREDAVNPEQPTEPIAEEVAPKAEVSVVAERERYTVAALRSNLLLPGLNVGLEVPVGNRWSIGADYYYPWMWPSGNNKSCFELAFWSLEGRYWFGKKHTADLANRAHRLTGHSVALYGAWGYFDFERNYHGRQGNAWSVGVDYVYALPVAKGKVHFEFQVAVGALLSSAQPYNVYEVGGNLYRETGHKKSFNYVGPTKVGISLVVPLHKRVPTSNQNAR